MRFAPGSIAAIAALPGPERLELKCLRCGYDIGWRQPVDGGDPPLTFTEPTHG